MGGYGGGSGADVDIYDISANTWSNKYNVMPYGTSAFSSTALNGKIYCFGGSDTTRVQVYDIKNDKWIVFGHMAKATQTGASGTIDGKIYVSHGFHNGGRIADTYEYKPYKSIIKGIDTLKAWLASQ